MKLDPTKCVFGVASGKFLIYVVTKRGIEANPKQIKLVLNIASPKCKKDVQKLTERVVALSQFISRSSERCHNFFNTLKKNTDFVWVEEYKEALQQLKNYLTSVPLLSKPLDRETLFVYLVVSEHAVSAVLMHEDEGKQSPIYYVSKVLLDVETYSQLEN